MDTHSNVLFLVLSNVLMTSQKSTRIDGAGASFPASVYRSWGLYYQTHRVEFKNVRMSYDSIGSGGGKEAITQVSNDRD